MRYNPATDQARDIDVIAAECKAAINTLPVPLWVADEVFAADSCRVWSLCRESAASREDRTSVARLESYLARDMHAAMHHRPHQREF